MISVSSQTKESIEGLLSKWSSENVKFPVDVMQVPR